MARSSKTQARNRDAGLRELTPQESAAVTGARATSVTPAQVGALASLFTSVGGPGATSGLWPINPTNGPMLPGRETF